MSFDAIPNLLADLIEEQKKTREAVIQLAEALAGVRAKVEKTKAEKPAAAPAAEPAKTEPKAEKPAAPAPAPTAAPADYAPVGAAITAYAAANGREAAIAKLASLGVKSGKELKPEQYAQALALFTAAEVA